MALSGSLRRYVIVIALANCLFVPASRGGESDGISLNVHRGSRAVALASLESQSNLVIAPSQSLEQTFTIEADGTLLGVEIAPLLDTALPGDTMILDLLDGRVTLLGSVAISVAAFPPGSGSTPEPLIEDAQGPGYFDLSGFDVHVTAGQVLSVVLRTESGAGVCNHLMQQCAEGDVGQSCSSDVECERAMRAGTSFGLYPDGELWVNGMGFPADLAFKVIVLGASPAQGVSLSWTGGASPYDVYRSGNPATLLDPLNLIATTPATSFDDLPSPGQLWCYEVTSQP